MYASLRRPTAPRAARKPCELHGRRETRPGREVRERRGRRALGAFSATVLAAPLLIAASAPRAAAEGEAAQRGDRLARELVRRTGAEGAARRLEAFQSIAGDIGGNRAAGTRGHVLSAKYAGSLLKAAGYKVRYQNFGVTYRETLAERLTLLAPEQRAVRLALMTYTRSTPKGGIRAPIAAVPAGGDDSPGCEAADYAAGGFAGHIALIRRGGCTFARKQATAAAAGAVGAVIYNSVDGVLGGSLGAPGAARIPTGGIGKADGEALARLVAAGSGATVNLEVREFQERRTTPNVIAETRGGDPGNVVMLGAHLDSVAEGPGINDNGSAASGLLEAALQLAHTRDGAHGSHRNKVRFALWSAEELSLLGSKHYVAHLSREEREGIALYLNFDMIASPNYGLFVYDGDDSDGVGAGPGPAGSARLESDLASFIASRGEQTRGTDFAGRSDYGPFTAIGIPSGGAFTGAEGIKTAEERKLWGGTAGAAYDGCYHQTCDDARNIDRRALDVNVKAIANAVGHYAWDTSAVP